MKTISDTHAKKELPNIIEQVCEDHTPIIITLDKAPSVVILSLEDYEVLQKTAHLPSSSNNSHRFIEDMT